MRGPDGQIARRAWEGDGRIDLRSVTNCLRQVLRTLPALIVGGALKNPLLGHSCTLLTSPLPFLKCVTSVAYSLCEHPPLNTCPAKGCISHHHLLQLSPGWPFCLSSQSKLMPAPLMWVQLPYHVAWQRGFRQAATVLNPTIAIDIALETAHNLDDGKRTIHHAFALSFMAHVLLLEAGYTPLEAGPAKAEACSGLHEVACWLQKVPALEAFSFISAWHCCLRFQTH